MGMYKKGDHVKIEVEDKQFGVGEWMWLLVEDSDDAKRLVFGLLDNEPMNKSRHEARATVSCKLRQD